MSTATMVKSPVQKMADEFYRMLEKGHNMEAIDEFYAENIENIEGSAQEPAIRGIEKVRAYNEKWMQENEIHSCKLEGPFSSEHQFGIVMHLDVTMNAGKAENHRVKMSEIALYTVENNKITRAEFLYGDMK
jgi:hypothetical protein